MQRYHCSFGLHVLGICCACTVYAMCLPCMWGKPTKGDRTIDRVRVNGFKMVSTNCGLNAVRW